MKLSPRRTSKRTLVWYHKIRLGLSATDYWGIAGGKQVDSRAAIDKIVDCCQISLLGRIRDVLASSQDPMFDMWLMQCFWENDHEDVLAPALGKFRKTV